jgi:hypothetical protein
MENQITDTRWHYNLGYEEAKELTLEIIEKLRDTGNYDLATLNAIETEIEEDN